MRKEWIYCDGGGGLDRTAASMEPGPSARPQDRKTAIPSPSRRSILALGSLGLIGWMAGRKSALAQVGLSHDAEERDLLVVIFLRGGADGLNVVAPYGDDGYYRLRPSLALPKPTSSAADRTLDLDGFFAFHPVLAPIYPQFKEGKLAVLHAVGSNDHTRSHFEAMSAMERGLPQASTGAASGWLARYLTASRTDRDSPLRAVALGPILPDSLRGGGTGNAVRSVADYRLNADSRFERLLKLAYAGGDDEAVQAGRDTLKILDALNKLDPKGYRAGTYPQTELGEGLKQTALLAKAGVGLEVACLDKGGWDTHVAQGGTTGWLASQLDDVAKSLAGFVADMGERMARTTVVVMTEFGRRAYENTGLGTDHGRASFMFLMGGGVKGGKVYADWPGLAEHKLEEQGDLRVTTDYRNVLAEVLERRMALQDSQAVFEGLNPKSVGALQDGTRRLF